MATSRAVFATSLLLLLGSCAPQPPELDPKPAQVDVAELAQRYKDNHASAASAFSDRLVHVRVTVWDKSGLPSELRWIAFYGRGEPKPSVVLRLSEPLPPGAKPPLWVEGTCRGDAFGYVLVTGCRAIQRSPAAAR